MKDLIAKIIKESCIQASFIVMKIYDLRKKKDYKKDLNLSYKKDGSPLTNADRLANEIIVANLKNFFPNIPIISEESSDIVKRNIKDFFLVDPLDGTKEFLRENGEFTINIGYVSNKIALLGAVCHPSKNKIFWTETNSSWSANFIKNSNDDISFSNRQKLSCKSKQRGVSVIVSRSHLDDNTKKFIFKKRFKTIKKLGSSLKIIRICENSTDFYPRFGTTMEWDICAAHAILNLSGGFLLNNKKKNMLYGKRNFENKQFFALGKIQDIDYYFN